MKQTTEAGPDPPSLRSPWCALLSGGFELSSAAKFSAALGLAAPSTPGFPSPQLRAQDPQPPHRTPHEEGLSCSASPDPALHSLVSLCQPTLGRSVLNSDPQRARPAATPAC